jgi:hypothetical protein
VNVSLWQAGLVLIAGLVFAVRVSVLLRRHLRVIPEGRATCVAASRFRSGAPVLRPVVSADASGSPTPLASAGSTVDWNTP